MDKYLKLKQIGFKIGIPLIILAVLIFVISAGMETKQNPQINNNSNLSLFKEDELVATRYTDSIEDKLNLAVSSQDNIKSENEKMKKEIESLKQYINKKEEKDKNNPLKKDNLYNSFPDTNPKIPDLINSEIPDNFTQKISPDLKQTKILYKVMDQTDINKTPAIDPNFGKIEKNINQNINTEKLYIPTTAISKGALLHGLNAPTSMSKPMPTVVMIKDVAFLPNRKRFNIKECNLLVEGYGQLSDERAYFKFTKFVCINEDGKKIYDTKASGYLTSLTDNKQGLPGHVVSKQDAMLGRMFLAGVFEGASEMFKNTGQTQIVSPLGTTTSQSTDTKDIANNMIGGGLGTASESAKELYLEKARNISETVEILSQEVGLVFTDGLVLEPIDFEKQKKEENEKNS
ncbi:MAG: TraB/VirB10 family protein [Arcobacter sp.]|uniref:TraB/VirB10 family protein n=1 Tax=Arcobacter sp. TaxID=1872629 RepID=UPI003CFF7F47